MPDIMLITRGFSLTNFVIASSALGFQVFVLYPWHKKLDDDFEELKREHMRVIKEGEEERKKDMAELKDAIAKMRWRW